MRLVPALTACAVVLTVGTAVPASASKQRPAAATSPAPVTTTRTVRLVTGDTVRVSQTDDGRTQAAIVSGPHVDAPVVRWSTERSSYLVPRTSPAERRVLDVSMFDVARLARTPAGRLPVVVTFRRGATATQRRAVAGRATDALAARTSYATARRALTQHDLGAVRSVRLVGATSTPQVTGPTHQLSIHVASTEGGASTFIENVDDPTTFLATPSTDDAGDLTVDVPDGHYAVLAYDFGRLAIAPELSVDADTDVTVDLASATVRPRVTLPDYRGVDAVLSVLRTPENGAYIFPIEFSGPRFFMRVPPTSGDVDHGSLSTAVSAKLRPTDGGTALAVTADVADGVPDDLTFRHHRRDFARVVQHAYATGPVGPRQAWVDALGPNGSLFDGRSYPMTVPGRRTLLLQASRTTYFQQTLFPQATPSNFDNVTQLISVRRFTHPGRRYTTTFAHAPVGPGLEAGQTVRRIGDRLRSYASLFLGAGHAFAFGFVATPDGRWALRQGRHLLRRGHHQVGFDVPVPPGRRRYTLTAVSRPTSPLATLSTRVRDDWTFSSRHGAAPRVMTPSYVPPTTLRSTLAPGRTRFALRFAGPRRMRVSHARLELSTDHGRHWTDAHLSRRGPTSFAVRYANPAAAGDRDLMSVRVTARDPQGDTVTETAIDVYRLLLSRSARRTPA